jgi:hypothetical protein
MAQQSLGCGSSSRWRRRAHRTQTIPAPAFPSRRVTTWPTFSNQILPRHGLNNSAGSDCDALSIGSGRLRRAKPTEWAYLHPKWPANVPNRPLIHLGILIGGALRKRCSTPELLRLSCVSSLGWPANHEPQQPVKRLNSPGKIAGAVRGVPLGHRVPLG